MIREILVWPDPRLKVKSTPVEKVDDAIRKLCDDMAETMYASNGVGLAAPQIGVTKRVIAMDVEQRSADEEESDENQEKSSGLFWLINPVIRVSDGELYTYNEGCLSVPDEYEEITRPGHVVIDFLDRDGKAQTIEATDCLLSVCVQHEIDHLEGKLFVDRISALKRELIRRRMKKLKADRDAEKKGTAAVL
ncbi:MAG: peptide deformylase [Deltaproteobacteria bacterium]|nr:peptide deformylase [Deltaproteobacteria bacterium]